MSNYLVMLSGRFQKKRKPNELTKKLSYDPKTKSLYIILSSKKKTVWVGDFLVER